MMSVIPLTDADGSEGLPICRAQREWLVSRYKSESMIALKFFSDDLPVASLDAGTDAKAIDHVRKCPKCRDWLHRVVPADVQQEQSHIRAFSGRGSVLDDRWHSQLYFLLPVVWEKASGQAIYSRVMNLSTTAATPNHSVRISW
jgi:hypothetical protein